MGSSAQGGGAAGCRVVAQVVVRVASPRAPACTPPPQVHLWGQLRIRLSNGGRAKTGSTPEVGRPKASSGEGHTLKLTTSAHKTRPWMRVGATTTAFRNEAELQARRHPAEPRPGGSGRPPDLTCSLRRGTRCLWRLFSSDAALVGQFRARAPPFLRPLWSTAQQNFPGQPHTTPSAAASATSCHGRMAMVLKAAEVMRIAAEVRTGLPIWCAPRVLLILLAAIPVGIHLVCRCVVGGGGGMLLRHRGKRGSRRIVNPQRSCAPATGSAGWRHLATRVWKHMHRRVTSQLRPSVKRKSLRPTISGMQWNGICPIRGCHEPQGSHRGLGADGRRKPGQPGAIAVDAVG